uniref:Methyltransferase type 11 domain-containing protein n=1 Tax=Plectus sambesii TaxID=2011161 RepID=A0A914VYF0_9BILA
MTEHRADREKYRKQEYWDDRFSTEDAYEWLAGFDQIKELLCSWIKPDDKILHLGCGNSRLSFDLYDLGYKHVTNVDFAASLISRCKEQYGSSHPEVSWLCSDIRNMSALDDGSFDVVIEKATLDSLLVAEKSPWNMSDAGRQDLTSTLGEIARLLRAGGRFVSVTFAQPHFRLPHYAVDDYGWSCETRTLGTNFHFFAYCMVKGRPLDRTLVEPFLYAVRSAQREASRSPSPVHCADGDGDDNADWLKSIEVFEQ